METDTQPTLTQFIHTHFALPARWLHAELMTDGVVVDTITERTGSGEARERFLVDLLLQAGVFGVESLRISAHPTDEPWDTIASWEAEV